MMNGACGVLRGVVALAALAGLSGCFDDAQHTVTFAGDTGCEDEDAFRSAPVIQPAWQHEPVKVQGRAPWYGQYTSYGHPDLCAETIGEGTEVFGVLHDNAGADGPDVLETCQAARPCPILAERTTAEGAEQMVLVPEFESASASSAWPIRSLRSCGR
jgi:hypothetical protein